MYHKQALACIINKPWLVSLVGAATRIISVATKLLSRQAYFCRDKHVQRYAYRYKAFVATNTCKGMLIETKLLSRQTRAKVCLSRQSFCRDKHVQRYAYRDKAFVATNTCKGMLIETKLLSRQTRACRDKHYFVAKRKEKETCFVVTNICVSRQTRVCCDKTFVATKIILVAAPANHRLGPCHGTLTPEKNSKATLTPSLPQPVKSPG